MNDGTRDIGASPTNILLLRGLDTLTTEEDIIASLSIGVGEGASAAEKVRQGGIKNVMITKDRASRSSWGYAFVHFSDMKVSYFFISRFVVLTSTLACD